MKNNPYAVVPSPWWQVGLAMLPGFMLLSLGRASLPDPLGDVLRLLVLAATVVLSVSSFVPAVTRRSLLYVQAWGIVPLGSLAGIAAMFGLWAITGTFGLAASFLLLAVAGLVFARRYGAGAGLFVLIGGLFVASISIEPGMYLAPGPVARFLLGEGMFGLFWVFTPIIVLRARSTLGQVLGLLLPMAAYTAAFVFALSSYSGLAQPMFQMSISKAISVANPYIALLAAVALAALVYAWIAAQDVTADGERSHLGHALSDALARLKSATRPRRIARR